MNFQETKDKISHSVLNLRLDRVIGNHFLLKLFAFKIVYSKVLILLIEFMRLRTNTN